MDQRRVTQDEDADLQQHLAAFGPDAIAELKRVLEAPSDYRTACRVRKVGFASRRLIRIIRRCSST
jgi:hypothetical protein